jgi:hypothetical protein
MSKHPFVITSLLPDRLSSFLQADAFFRDIIFIFGFNSAFLHNFLIGRLEAATSVVSRWSLVVGQF